MEEELLNDVISLQNNQYLSSVDIYNDDTFGLTNDITDLNDDWEKQHEQVSKLLELEHDKVKKSSPLRLNHSIETSESSDSVYDKSSGYSRNGGRAFLQSSDEEEENIIGSSISQLCMDDDDTDYMSKSNGGLRTQSFEFQEIKESWNSPSRVKDHNASSLHELISPGEGVWASPSRSMLSDHVVPDIDMQRKEGEDIIKKLFGGHEIVTAAKSGGEVPKAKAIHLEDLERGLPRSPAPPGMGNQSRGHTPLPPGFLPLPMGTPMGTPYNNMGAPFNNMGTPLHNVPVCATPPGIPFPIMGSNTSHLHDSHLANSPAQLNQMQQAEIAAMLLKQQAAARGTPPGFPTHAIPSTLLSPQYFARQYYLPSPESFFNPSPRQQYSTRGHWKSNRGSRGGNNRSNYHNNDRSWNGGDRSWNSDKQWLRYPKQYHTDMKEQEEFMQMQPSKMMNAKEKEWIFKISLMSLLSGDPNITDFYFVSYMNKKMLEKTQDEEESKAVNEEASENLEKTKKLMTYAQKNQQAKESYKPVKFEGSLGKLSITSVHHPRQIMDLTTPDNEKTMTRTPEIKKKKFVLYRMVEKMYVILLSVNDVEHKFVDASVEEQEVILKERSHDINKMFQILKVNLHTSPEPCEYDHFLQLMTICKARKLLCRIFLLFYQTQSESLFIALLHVLPTLMKKDLKEKALYPLLEKFELMLSKSKEAYKIKCIQVLRKINLKLLLSYQFAIEILTLVLNSLQNKDRSSNLEWSYYWSEVPNVLSTLSSDSKKRSQKEIAALKVVLGINE